jgi:hypothetical protein
VVILVYGLLVMAGIALVLLFGQYGLRLIYGYKLTSDGIWIVLFNLVPVYKIPFKNVTNIHKCSFLEVGPHKITLLRLGNRLWGNFVLIKKSGVVRSIVITPNNAEEFVERCNALRSMQKRPR